MYQNQFKHFSANNQKTANGGRRKFFGNKKRSFSNNDNTKRGRFGNQRRGKGSFSQHINEAMFIKKACPVVLIEEALVKNTFEDFKLEKVLLKNIINKGYLKPTQIQDEIIPHILDGRDVLGISNTGTGKTAAFALPLINQIIKNPQKRILILSPTRELAQQIKQEFRSFTFEMKVYVALAIGGAYIKEQIIDIRRDPHIIIGTPGRIKDLAERKIIKFTKFDTLVLDEVDRMLDMGFIGDIKEIVSQIPTPHQTLFFSATVNKKIEPLVNSFLNNPAKVSIESQQSSKNVEQNVIRVNRGDKERVLCELLLDKDLKKVLVFVGTKIIAEKISKKLFELDYKVGSLHGNKSQYNRQRTLKAFKENVINILIATDVAARGLDVSDITHVINYDLPNNYDDYIHRIGRTGRANAKGYALTFIENK